LDLRDGTTYVAEHQIVLAVSIISILIAAILLIGAIAILSFVKNNGAQLLAKVAGFSTIFELSVGLLTNASRQEMFAATAAYAAFLVVFVSGTLQIATPTIVIVTAGI
jgi:hypothetical protein